MAQEITFEKYRKKIQDFYAPSGELLAFGYVREMDDDVHEGIPKLLAAFLDIYLGFDSSAYLKREDKWLTLTLPKKWIEMSEFEKRLMRDQLIFDPKKGITHIEVTVTSTKFGLEGITWIASIIKNVKELVYINLSNCQLNDECVKIICESIKGNQYKNDHPVEWLDVSDCKKVTDDSMEYILEVLHIVHGFNLNNTSITDGACEELGDFCDENEEIAKKLTYVKLDENKGITPYGREALNNLSKLCTIVFDEQ